MALLLVAALLVVVGALLVRSLVYATDNLFQYKFPCNPSDACVITTLPSTGHLAFDFDVQLGGRGEIRAVSEGIFKGYFGLTAECDENAAFGKHAKIDDMYGRSLTYAHLSEVGTLVFNERVLQGDLIGIEGDTGHTHHEDPHVSCADHLHLEGQLANGLPDGADGIPMSQILSNGTGTDYDSSNSPVGTPTPVPDAPAFAIREEYIDLGDPFTSWASVGWTADRSGTQEGCDSNTFCRLFVHYQPDPEDGHWGSIQTFRRHGDAQGFEYNGIMVGRWAVNNALRVDRPFFAFWFDNEQEPTSRDIGLALTQEVTSADARCPATVGCQRYQRFHLGYIWEDSEGVKPIAFCPDIDPYYPNYDNSVTVADIFAVAAKFGQTDPGQPFEPWADSWYDMEGDGAITTTDLFAVAAFFGAVCIPNPFSP